MLRVILDQLTSTEWNQPLADNVARKSPLAMKWHPSIIPITLLLTHLPLNRMAVISLTTCSNAISLKVAPKGPMDKKSALSQVTTWHRTGDKSLPESVMTQFTDAYMRH